MRLTFNFYTQKQQHSFRFRRTILDIFPFSFLFYFTTQTRTLSYSRFLVKIHTQPKQLLVGMPKRTITAATTPLPTLQESRFLEGTIPSPPPSPTRAITRLQNDLNQCREQLYELVRQRDTSPNPRSYDDPLQQLKLQMLSLINDRRELERDLLHVGLSHMYVGQTGSDLSRQIHASIIKDAQIEVRSDIPIRRVGSSHTRWSLASSCRSLYKEDNEHNFKPFSVLTTMDSDFDRENGLLSSDSSSDVDDNDNVFDADVEELDIIRSEKKPVVNTGNHNRNSSKKSPSSIPVRHVSFRSLRLQKQKQLEQEREPLLSYPTKAKDGKSVLFPAAVQKKEREGEQKQDTNIPKRVANKPKQTKIKPFFDENEDSPLFSKNGEKQKMQKPSDAKLGFKLNIDNAVNANFSSTPLAVKKTNINVSTPTRPLHFNNSTVTKNSHSKSPMFTSLIPTPLSTKLNRTNNTNNSNTPNNSNKGSNRPSYVKLALMKEASSLATNNKNNNNNISNKSLFNRHSSNSNTSTAAAVSSPLRF